MRVKICGITTPEDAAAASEAGADAIGLNFVSGPRKIEPDQANAILTALPPFVTPVALVDVSTGRVPEPIAKLLARHRVSHVQMYGTVTPPVVATLRHDGFRPLLVQHVRGDEFPDATTAFLHECGPNPPAAIVLDAYDPTLQGGTGRTLDWDRIAHAKRDGALANWPPLILAGGLTPENVAEAISIVQPWAVDVASGVEDLPGHKSPERMAAFVRAARCGAQRR